MRSVKKGQVDPLYIIFEQHLFNFQDSQVDRQTFISQVLQEYLSYLRKNSIAIPKSLEGPIIEELSNQIHTMLVKKIYGCVSIQDYLNRQSADEKRRARARVRVKYSKLGAR